LNRTVVRNIASLVVLITGLVLHTSVPQAQQSSRDIDADAVKAAIERALAVAPRGFEALQAPSQTGVRVLDVKVQRTSPTSQRITIDLSQRTLTWDPGGNMEAIVDHVLASTAALTAGARDVEYRLLVDGLPLDQFVPRAVPHVAPRALSDGGAVVISAGHGWYLDEMWGWRLQRDYYWGIVEDLVNWDIADYVRDEMRAAKLDVRPARHPERAAGVGASGNPEWQESAKYFIKALGAPPDVWDIGIDDYARDINSRPLYSNWIDSAVVVSIHNNGGGGTGTETWYDATNGQEAESERLAGIVNNKVVAAIRAGYDAEWPDRGLRSCNGCKGENRLAARPAIILEVAFMDMKTPDNAALHSETFKQIVARAIREALQEWAAPRSSTSTTSARAPQVP
jgi:N-acetylmuramoyl-L-alanine amidase